MNRKEEYIWYVCYGSNLCRRRLLSYLSGKAIEEYGIAESEPCADLTPPSSWRFVPLPYQLYFGKVSSTWKGGVAFLDEEKHGFTLGRAYLLSREQYLHIKRKEGPWYQKEIALGEIEGLPALTFTDTSKNREVAPSELYQEVIIEGLTEMGLSEEMASSYLNGRLPRSKKKPKDDYGFLHSLLELEFADLMQNSEELTFLVDEANKRNYHPGSYSYYRPSQLSDRQIKTAIDGYYRNLILELSNLLDDQRFLSIPAILSRVKKAFGEEKKLEIDKIEADLLALNQLYGASLALERERVPIGAIYLDLVEDSEERMSLHRLRGLIHSLLNLSNAILSIVGKPPIKISGVNSAFRLIPPSGGDEW